MEIHLSLFNVPKQLAKELSESKVIFSDHHNHPPRTPSTRPWCHHKQNLRGKPERMRGKGVMIVEI